jgi:putative flippase GtrA
MLGIVAVPACARFEDFSQVKLVYNVGDLSGCRIPQWEKGPLGSATSHWARMPKRPCRSIGDFSWAEVVRRRAAMSTQVPEREQASLAPHAALGIDEAPRVVGAGAAAAKQEVGIGIRREFTRYVLVGGFAFVCDTLTLFSLTQFLKVNYLISAPVGFVVGTIVNYVLSRAWVFQRRSITNTSAELIIFTLIGVVGLGLNELILWMFQSRLGIHYMYAKVVSGVAVFVWNFGARKVALFR